MYNHLKALYHLFWGKLRNNPVFIHLFPQLLLIFCSFINPLGKFPCATSLNFIWSMHPIFVSVGGLINCIWGNSETWGDIWKTKNTGVFSFFFTRWDYKYLKQIQVLGLGGRSTGVSKKINGPERKRLKDIAKLFRKPGFDLTARTEAAGQSQEDLEKDMMRLMETWKGIVEQAEAASMAADNGQDGAVPVVLHRGMGQTLSIVRDFFAEKVSDFE